MTMQANPECKRCNGTGWQRGSLAQACHCWTDPKGAPRPIAERAEMLDALKDARESIAKAFPATTSNPCEHPTVTRIDAIIAAASEPESKPEPEPEPKRKSKAAMARAARHARRIAVDRNKERGAAIARQVSTILRKAGFPKAEPYHPFERRAEGYSTSESGNGTSTNANGDYIPTAFFCWANASPYGDVCEKQEAKMIEAIEASGRYEVNGSHVTHRQGVK